MTSWGRTVHLSWKALPKAVTPLAKSAAPLQARVHILGSLGEHTCPLYNMASLCRHTKAI